MTAYTYIPHTGDRTAELPFLVGAEAHMLAEWLIKAGKRNIQLIDNGHDTAQVRVGKSLAINVYEDNNGKLTHQVKRQASGNEWFISHDLEATIKNITGKNIFESK